MKVFKEYKKVKNSVSMTPPIKNIEVRYCGENIYTDVDELTGRKADIVICSMNISKLGTDCLIVDGKNSPNQLIILIDTGLNDDLMINMRTDDKIDGMLCEDIIRRGAGVNAAIAKYMRTYYIITNTGELTIDIDEEINPRHLIPIIDWSYQHGFNTWNIYGSISVRTLEEIHKTIDDFVKCRNKRIQLTQ